MLGVQGGTFIIPSNVEDQEYEQSFVGKRILGFPERVPATL